ncbi:hypothetical protein CBS101457_001518 [Exobasidium rhododendri]|nr:hypothetical protein CBS101457_001518 [Exobasidium rhododendri]
MRKGLGILNAKALANYTSSFSGGGDDDDDNNKMWLTDQQKIGAALVSFGVLFLFLGIILFFDAALLALGNVLFTSGITLLIGPQKTFYFFARKEKLRGTICFFVGMILVFAKWTIIGMMVELFGFLNLFGDFFPVILNFLRQMPFIGTALNLPVVRNAGRDTPISRLSSVKTYDTGMKGDTGACKEYANRCH